MNRLAAFFLLMLLILAPACALGHDISVAEYRDQMSALLHELDAGHLAAAQQQAAKLKGVIVTSPDSRFSADASILQPIQKAAAIVDAQKQRAKISTLLAALNEKDSANTSAEPDRVRLETLRRDEARILPPKDGEADDGGIIDSGYAGAIFSYIANGLKWMVEKVSDVLKWFENLFPSPRSGMSGEVGPIIKYLVIAFAIVLVGLMLRAYLRSRKFKPVASEFAPINAPASSKDADPLSRDSGQWEEYAAKLASAGRHREAIRAWYHAVLAMLFRSGVLTYRKGRTNWEYVFSFSPDVPNRRDFQELTGSFEVEWYGKSSSAAGDANRYGEYAKQFLMRTRSGRNA